MKSSPSKEAAAIEAKRAAQLDDLDHDVKQVMNYADEKVIQLGSNNFWNILSCRWTDVKLPEASCTLAA